jgi:hypothetical protein
LIEVTRNTARIVLVDVRSEEEHKKFHILGSLNIPADKILGIAHNLAKDREYHIHDDKVFHSIVMYLHYKSFHFEPEFESDTTQGLKVADGLLKLGFNAKVVDGNPEDLKKVGFLYYAPPPPAPEATASATATPQQPPK